jgi:hypothetical protein
VSPPARRSTAAQNGRAANSSEEATAFAAKRAGRNSRTQWRLCGKIVVKPSRSCSVRDTSFAESVSERPYPPDM